MFQTRVFASYTFFVLLCFLALSALKAQDAPDGKPGNISDWALAGVVWSDASLAKKVAVTAARQSDDPQELKRLQEIIRRSDRLIQSMEQFGWKQLVRKPNSSARSGDAARRESIKNATQANQADNATSSPSQTRDRQTSDSSQKSLPSPDRVGDQVAKSLPPKPDALSDSGASTQEASETAKARRERKQTRTDAGQPTRRAQIDTETPLGRDDPGVDDERIEAMPARKADIDHYRVDDVIDETPGERANTTDAVEDGVETAIAAANVAGISGPVAGRISEREALTISTKRPYALDSIYDMDDYDPDIDFKVNEEPKVRTLKPVAEAEDRVDETFEDDVYPREPNEAADGEDELLASIADGTPTPASERSPLTRMSDFTAEKTAKRSADANWVQFHLDENQAFWNRIKDRSIDGDMLRDVLRRLQVSRELAIRATDNQRLKSALAGR